MTRLYRLSILLLTLSVFAMGCTTTKKRNKELGIKEKEDVDAKVTQKYLSFHSFETQRGNGSATYPVEFAAGRMVYLNPAPLLSSRYIKQAETITVRDGVALRFTLDDRGTNQWSQLSGTYRDRVLVLMIDGQFRSFVRIREFSSESTFELAGPFDPDEAAGIVKYAPVNFTRGPGEKIN